MCRHLNLQRNVGEHGLSAQVVEDEEGAVRKENGRAYAEMLAKQRDLAAAQR